MIIFVRKRRPSENLRDYCMSIDDVNLARLAYAVAHYPDPDINISDEISRFINTGNQETCKIAMNLVFTILSSRYMSLHDTDELRNIYLKAFIWCRDVFDDCNWCDIHNKQLRCLAYAVANNDIETRDILSSTIADDNDDVKRICARWDDVKTERSSGIRYMMPLRYRYKENSALSEHMMNTLVEHGRYDILAYYLSNQIASDIDKNIVNNHMPDDVAFVFYDNE